jgi:hypothetical protein
MPIVMRRIGQYTHGSSLRLYLSKGFKRFPHTRPVYMCVDALANQNQADYKFKRAVSSCGHPSNGEVEGPPRSARSRAAGAHCLPAPAARNHQPFTVPSNDC